MLANFGKVATAAGRHADAMRWTVAASATAPKHPRPLYDLAMAYLAAGLRREARAAFDGADPAHPHYPIYRAFLYVQLGDLDSAFQWLGRVHEWGVASLGTLTSDPALRALRAGRRYAELRQRIGLPPIR